MKPDVPISLDTWMARHAKPGVIYHIGTCSGFIFIGTRETYRAEMSTISIIHKEKIKRLFKNELRLLIVNTEERAKINIFGTPADIDYNLAHVVDMFLLDAENVRRSLQRHKRAFDQFISFGERNVREVYDRLLGGVVILIDGEEPGDFWFREEYEAAMAEYRVIKNTRNRRGAIEQIVNKHNNEGDL